ncbi:MAG TPA: DinB family protein [Humisphaera sp.]
MDRSLIDEFERGGRLLREAVEGLSPQELKKLPPAEAGVGKWSVHQVVVHMADADAIGIHRMKRVIAEPNPLLIGYDESAFARSLFYDDQSTADALTLFDVGRRAFAPVLRKLPDAAFARAGCHNEHGMVTLAAFVKMYVEHLDHHLNFIRLKRGM